MTQPETVQMHFAGNRFGNPCSLTELERAESILKQRLPDSLRELYLAFDGFYGPALTSFFWPLFISDDRPGYGLVDSNLALREDTVSGYPEFVLETLFFGGNERIWGIKHDQPDQIIEWDAWDSGFKIVGRTPLEVWLAEKKFYDNWT